ncbi:MAG: hypothetical protein WCS77_01370 [Elusimicrobiaceae bacterium]
MALLNFISRTVFIKVLGSEYLGINGVLGNVFMFLSIADMGLSTAIGFSLYKPLASKDYHHISTLMAFYRRVYQYVAVAISIAGLLLAPFLQYLVKSHNPIEHLHIYYLIFLANTVAGYLLIYPQTLITADQKTYKTVPFAVGFNLLWTAAQITVLLTTHNYFAYLLTQSAVIFLERYFTNRYIKKSYPEVSFETKEKLPEEDLQLIKKNVKAMLWHKIGDFGVNGIATLVISARLSVSLAGIYSNYVMIIGVVKGFLLLAPNSVAASFGNLISTESKEKCLEKSKVLDFITFWAFGATAVCFYNMLNPFIVLWVGKEYLFSQATVAIILTDYYLTGARVSLYVVKTSGGIYAQDKYLPAFQAVANLVFSLILADYMGVSGVFLGMILSTFIFPFWYRAIIVYKHIFAAPARGYFLRYGLYLAVVAANAAITAFICSTLFSAGGWWTFAGRGLVSLIIPNAVIFILFRNTSEMRQIIKILRQYLNSRLKWGTKSA